MKNRVVVPEGMLKAVGEESNWRDMGNVEILLQSALRWLTENPIVPDENQVSEVSRSWCARESRVFIGYSDFSAEWQRRMFLATEEENNDSVDEVSFIEFCSNYPYVAHKSLAKAFRLGQKSVKK